MDDSGNTALAAFLFAIGVAILSFSWFRGLWRQRGLWLFRFKRRFAPDHWATPPPEPVTQNDPPPMPPAAPPMKAGTYVRRYQIVDPVDPIDAAHTLEERWRGVVEKGSPPLRVHTKVTTPPPWRASPLAGPKTKG